MLLGGYFTGGHSLCMSGVALSTRAFTKGSSLGSVLWKVELLCFWAGGL